MSEEKDAAQAAREMAETEGELSGLPPLKPQLGTSPGVGERAAVARRRERVRELLPRLSAAARQAIFAADELATRPLPQARG
jgi:phospholipid/cholesterol/gamma-HCH transport system ATP-binding protein